MPTLKLGEKIFLGFVILITVAAFSKGAKQLHDPPNQPRDYYVWTELALKGHTLYRSMGCNSCHRAMGVGEVGVAPVLDGEGTKRSAKWLKDYFIDPPSMVPGTAHDGSLGDDFRKLSDPQRELLAAFLGALRANPGSSNYPRPPQDI